MPTVLVVEDDDLVRDVLTRSLTAAGYDVTAVGTAIELMRRITPPVPDLVVLDLGLPDLDGSQVLRMLRAVSRVPVIIATARNEDAEIVRLLRDGADDYLVKPFSSEQLAARVHAVLRRSGQAPPSRLQVGDLVLDLQARGVTLEGKTIELNRREFDLLAYMARRAGAVVTRRELLTEVWRGSDVYERTIDVHLFWLRRKLGETAAAPRYLHTVRGVGLRLEAPRS
ncbi:MULTISPECIES: response regulator transcription factor [Streptomyces]|uniref:DNA-binding response regulator n=2 Tax=Streptomyces TaxID=1883 RepID=A0A3R7EM98_9ACTN|nr:MULTISPECIES: response regulator transcription factor [Streptomyces]MZE81273.1 response regulator [Streptomyces sp. SID5475]KNE81680.1 response regulator [Streptomyces fradiae]MCC3650263.1 response regulator transcription factor [Streptomyces sp. S07_1.15]MCC5036891.1 response regulator transcription factor [Streptomyces sp. WAC 00631]MCC9737974.1 response regulator transcription factor [Streptomyces sp. MNU89]